MKTLLKKGRGSIFATLLILLLICLTLTPIFTRDKKQTIAVADSGDVMTISSYTIDMRVKTDRTVDVSETIVMTANKSGSRFTRSLPLEGNRYFNLSAKCVGENANTYVENGDGFLDLVCELPTSSGVTRTYQIFYTMEQPRTDMQNGMQLDVVGFGWSVPLNNVSVTLHFPETATIEKAMITRYGSASATQNFDEYSLSSDGKTLHLKANRLNTYYNAEYNEKVTEGVYVRFVLPDGVLQSFVSTQVFPNGVWKIFVVGGVGLTVAILIALLLKKKDEIITSVNVTAPDNMDPLKMGKLIDGNVDNEDITSMIYYFAHKGYLAIDLEDEENPTFIRRVEHLPEDSPVYEQTLFEGLFKSGAVVRVSDLKERFYLSAESAKKQLLMPKMYEKKSVLAFLSGGILAFLMAVILPFWLGRERIGCGYSYILGFSFLLPIVLVWGVESVRENNRYKWKKGKRFAFLLLEILIAFIFSCVFIFAFASHVMTRWEKLYLSAFVMLTTFMTTGALTRTEKYRETLGQILGFKDFIVVTEEDKIKFMLEENPQLYYKVLPYAQVLGVTNEWEKKFKGILIEPPTWCSGGRRANVFDYLLLNACLRSAMRVAMTRPQPKGGSYVGKSGGGGRFGGFGGGGFGGGGGSWR